MVFGWLARCIWGSPVRWRDNLLFLSSVCLVWTDGWMGGFQCEYVVKVKPKPSLLVCDAMRGCVVGGGRMRGMEFAVSIFLTCCGLWFVFVLLVVKGACLLLLLSP